MATVIAIDLSVSMLRDIKIKDTKESFTLLVIFVALCFTALLIWLR